MNEVFVRPIKETNLDYSHYYFVYVDYMYLGFM